LGNNKIFRIFLFLLFLISGYEVRSQLSVTEGAAMGMTPQELVEQWLVGQGVFVSNCTFNGSTALITSTQIGTFTAIGNAVTELGLPAGVLLTSGQASIAIGPNDQPGDGASTLFGGDPDLDIIANASTQDKAVIEFDFVPQSDTLKFRYVFGSEEFYEYCNSYNDAFGFFLSGPGITGTFSNNSEDIALMPTIPVPVTINNLCADPFSNWNNAGGLNYQYDGLSYVFTAWHVVTPCSTYHIKLAIADALDKALDSGVFLEKNSFNSTGLLVNNSYTVPKLGTKAVEGCNQVTISFVLSQPISIPYTVHYTVGGTATRGVDYTNIPDSLVIPAGQDSTAIVIDPLIDGIPEGVETCVLNIEQPSCSGMAIFHDSIFIFDPATLSLVPENDTTLCLGDSARLVAIPIGGERPLQYLWNVPLGTDTAIWVKPPAGANLYSVVVTDLCGTAAHDTAIVTVNPLPHFTNTDFRDTICPGGTTNILFSSSVPSTTYTWTAVNPGGHITGYSSGSGPSIIQTLQNNTTFRDSVLYTAIPQTSLCQGGDTTFTVVVQPLPDAIVNNTTPVLCDGQTVNINISSTLAGAAFTWTSTCTSPFVIGYTNGTGSLIGDKLFNTGNTIDTVKYFIHASANGCSGPVIQTNVIINPVPAVTNSPLTKTICSGTSTNVLLISNVPGASFSWTANLMSGTVAGFSNGSGNPINQVLVNGAFIPGMVRYRITPSANGCPGLPSDFDVTVNPLPDVANVATSYPVCSGNAANISLLSNIVGTAFSWTAIPSAPTLSGYTNSSGTIITDVLINSATNTDSVAYTITPSAAGCTGNLRTLYAVVVPVPNVYSTPPAAALCSGQNTGFTLTSDVLGTTYSWTAVPSSGNVTGFSAGTGNTISQTLANTGNAIETVTYTITPLVPGCPAGSPINVIATVNPVPLLTNSPLSKQICDNTNTNILLTSNLAGALFTWTCTPSSANITGWTNNAVPTATLNQTLDNTGYNIEWVTYEVTPAANSCNGPVTDYVVTVYPTPDLSNTPLSMQLCNNTSTNFTLTSNTAGTLFTWTCTPSSANVTGWANNAVPTTLLNQTLNNSGLNNEWVTYHITPAANGCAGPITDYTVNVVQSPDVFFNPSAQTICSQQTSNIQVLSSVPGTTFTWTATPSGPAITGESPGSGNLIAQTITNSGTNIGWVTYQVTPAVSGCPPGLSQDVVLTVNPTPSITNAVTTFQICSASATNIIPTATVHSSTFSWTASGSSPNVSGYSNGSGMAIIQTLTNSGFNVEGVTYQVTPTAYGCPGPSTAFSVTVYPVADVICTPSGQTICSGTNTAVNLFSTAAGASFTWIAAGSSPTISGYSTGTGNQIRQTLFNSGPYPGTVTYIVSPSANGCPGIDGSAVITVNPLPAVSFTPCFDPAVSANSQPVALKGAIPLGGIYAGTGVTAGIFYPGFAGPGLHTISYAYTNTWGCPDTAFATINVVNIAPFTCGNVLTDPRDNQSYPTVLIGGQCWIAANLNYGSNIPSVQMQRDNCIPEKYCFGDTPANCVSTGGMYQWDEVMGYSSIVGVQGMCPPEWHLPSENEWNALFSVYISNGFAGSPLKYTGYSGFNALLSGTRFNNVQWDFNNFAVMFWSSSSHGQRKAWAHGMNTYDPSVSFYPSHRNNAFFVRCIKD
jgi:uncharacterized protein (TIGR02145 family)